MGWGNATPDRVPFLSDNVMNSVGRFLHSKQMPGVVWGIGRYELLRLEGLPGIGIGMIFLVLHMLSISNDLRLILKVSLRYWFPAFPIQSHPVHWLLSFLLVYNKKYSSYINFKHVIYSRCWMEHEYSFSLFSCLALEDVISSNESIGRSCFPGLERLLIVDHNFLKCWVDGRAV